MSALPERIPLDGRLTFEEARHVYRLDGEVIPGITSVLKRAGIIDDRFYSAEARDRGSAVHTAIEYLQEGDLERKTLAPLLVPYVEAWERFRDEMGWEPIERPELLVGSETLRFATRIDGVGVTRGCPLVTVCNWKTGSGYSAWWAIQSAGETIAYSETFGRSLYAMRRASVLLTTNGRYKFDVHDDKNDYAVFRGAAVVAHWKNANG